MGENFRRKRDFKVCGVIGLCALTRQQLIKELFSIPTEPVSATVDLAGVPAVISAIENPKLAEMYENATMTIIDGMPIVKIGKKLGFNCERCSAPDIMEMVFKESIAQGKSHYFYGGNDDNVLTKLRNNLETDYPGINIVGMYSPPFRALTDEEDKQICSDINKLHPDFLWVGIGAPKQEMWMWQHQEKIHGTVMLGIGAGFNFIAGTLDKAPKWVENLSLEWLYRLIKEPRRLWKRYIIGGFKWIYYWINFKIKG